MVPQFLTSFMCIIIVLCLSIVYAKFGFGALEDNFISRLYTSYDSVTQFVSFYTLLNLYLYLLGQQSALHCIHCVERHTSHTKHVI